MKDRTSMPSMLLYGYDLHTQKNKKQGSLHLPQMYVWLEGTVTINTNFLMIGILDTSWMWPTYRTGHSMNSF